jgi:hypothetical protein
MLSPHQVCVHYVTMLTLELTLESKLVFWSPIRGSVCFGLPLAKSVCVPKADSPMYFPQNSKITSEISTFLYVGCQFEYSTYLPLCWLSSLLCYTLYSTATIYGIHLGLICSPPSSIYILELCDAGLVYWFRAYDALVALSCNHYIDSDREYRDSVLSGPCHD